MLYGEPMPYHLLHAERLIVTTSAHALPAELLGAGASVGRKCWALMRAVQK